LFKKLFSDTIIYSLPTVANRLVGIVFFIFLARYLGPEEFGTIELITLSLIFINRIISLEINRGFGREVIDKSDREVSTFISTTYTFLLLGYLLLILILLLLPSSFIDLFIGINKDNSFFLLFLLLVFTNSFFLMTLEIFRWSLYPLTYSLLSLASVVLGSFLSFVFIYYFDSSLMGFIIGQVLAQLSLFLVGFFILFSKFNIGLKIEIDKLRAMLNYSYPIFIFLIAFFFLNYLDRWMISHFYSNEEVGRYSSIFRIANILSIFLLGSRLAFTPIAFRNKDSSEQFSSLMHFIVYCLLLISLVVAGFGEQITFLILGEDYSQTYTLLPFLLLSKIFLTIYIFSPGLEISRETHKLLYVSIIPACFAFFLSYWLTKNIGIYGTAIASSISSFIFIVLYLNANERTGRVKYNWLGFLSCIVLFLLFSFSIRLLQDPYLIFIVIIIVSILMWKLLFNRKEKNILLTGLNEIRKLMRDA
jgi:O-antigen/teichoic acid export membrane protein